MRKEKNERVSVRCTSKEKEILNERAEKLELNLSDYVKKILFPKERGYAEPIQLIIATQEEVDELWDMVKKLL